MIVIARIVHQFAVEQQSNRRGSAIVGLLLCALLIGLGVAPASALEPAATPSPTTPPPRAYLPLLVKTYPSTGPFTCPTGSANRYGSGSACQFNLDNPVRPALARANKNLALRGYVANTDASLRRELANYGADEPPTRPATLQLPAAGAAGRTAARHGAR